MPAMASTPRISLPRAADRIGILSFDHAKLHQQHGTLIASTTAADYEIPTAQLTAILAGPGTSITHAAATPTPTSASPPRRSPTAVDSLTRHKPTPQQSQPYARPKAAA